MRAFLWQMMLARQRSSSRLCLVCELALELVNCLVAVVVIDHQSDLPIGIGTGRELYESIRILEPLMCGLIERDRHAKTKFSEELNRLTSNLKGT